MRNALAKLRRERATTAALKALQPYRAVIGRDLDNYFEQVAENYASLSSPFAYYVWLVAQLEELPDCELVPLSSAGHRPDPGVRRVALRHDIDADPVTAVRAARHLARRGVPGSFYLLHTAPYYGDMHHGTFVRHRALAEWVRGLVAAGCEIGVHNDALGLVAQHGIDGVAALAAELHWLRGQAANVMGTVAHNSIPVLGAENYEVFTSHMLWPRTVRLPDGRTLPLGALDPQEVSVAYEGTWARPHRKVDVAAAQAFAARSDSSVRDAGWMRDYLLRNPCCAWELDYQFWLVGRDEWVVGGRWNGGELFEPLVDGCRVAELLAELPRGSRTVIVLHPAYFRG